MDITVPRDDDSGFDQLKEKILYLLDHYGKQLESLNKDSADTKITLHSIQKDVTSLREEQKNQKKTMSSLFGEALKMVSAIVTAYLLFKFGLL